VVEPISVSQTGKKEKKKKKKERRDRENGGSSHIVPECGILPRKKKRKSPRGVWRGGEAEPAQKTGKKTYGADGRWRKKKKSLEDEKSASNAKRYHLGQEKHHKEDEKLLSDEWHCMKARKSRIMVKKWERSEYFLLFRYAYPRGGESCIQSKKPGRRGGKGGKAINNGSHTNHYQGSIRVKKNTGGGESPAGIKENYSPITSPGDGN